MTPSIALNAPPPILWTGQSVRNPVLFFLAGESSTPFAQQMAKKYQFRYLSSQLPNFRETLLDGVKGGYCAIVDSHLEAQELRETTAYLKQHSSTLFKTVAIFLERTSRGKPGYPLTVFPNQRLVSVCIDLWISEINRQNGQSIFDRYENENQTFKELRSQVIKDSAHSPFFPASLEFQAFASVDEKMRPLMRTFDCEVDVAPTHAPYIDNEILLPGGKKTSASLIPFKTLDQSCPNFIATHSPAVSAWHFWSMVYHSGSTLLIQLVSEYGSQIPDRDNDIVCLDIELLFKDEEVQITTPVESVIKSTFTLKTAEGEREITCYWIKDWIDGKAIRQPALLDFVFDKIHAACKENPTLTPIVFCRGGVGRTGTFLTAYLMKHLAHYSRLYPLDRHLALSACLFVRMHRNLNFMSLEQYTLLYNLAEMFSSFPINNNLL